MLCEPAFVTRHRRSDSQGKTFLAEQSVAAIAGAIAPDLPGLGEVDDVLILAVTGPGNVCLPGFERRADRMQTGHERAVVAEHLKNLRTHARHDAHIGDDIGAVRDLYADMCDMRTDRTHAERNHIHRPPAHRSLEETRKHVAHLGRLAPVIRRSGVFFVFAADIRAVFDTRNVCGIRLNEIAVRSRCLVETLRRTCRKHDLEHAIVFFLRAVAPFDRVGLSQRGDLIDPSEKLGVIGGGVLGVLGRIRHSLGSKQKTAPIGAEH